MTLSLVNAFIGLGAEERSDATNKSPVTTFDAQPDLPCAIQPATRYYVSWGTYVVGVIIDVTLTANQVLIDFTGKDAAQSTVTKSFY